MTPPRRTHDDLPTVGGMIKQSPEDFVVEEVPDTEPEGVGEHLWLWVEKRQLGTNDVRRRLASALDVQQSEIGCAGLKDTVAIARQWFSVPAGDYDLESIADVRLRVLRATPHPQKLRTGHLRGNRFEVVIRSPGNPEAADTIVQRVRTQGFANFYGEQRFGRDGSNTATGLALLKGERRMAGFQQRLMLSAVQSAMFNDWLQRRIRDNLLFDAVDGDVVEDRHEIQRWVLDSASDREAIVAGKLHVTGPMFGPKMRRPKQVAAQREQAVLDAWKLDLEAFGKFKRLAHGTRRRAVMRPASLACERRENALFLKFELPPGVYATVLLREFIAAR